MKHKQNSNNGNHHRSKHLIRTLRAGLNVQRTFGEKIADFLTVRLGSMGFLTVNMCFFALWAILNSGIAKNFIPFDPYPFHFLVFFVSIEAIFLAIVVLISQNRSSKMEDLREEVDLQIDIIAEREISKALHLLVELLKSQKIAVPEETKINEMLLPLDTDKIERILMEEVRQEVRNELAPIDKKN